MPYVNATGGWVTAWTIGMAAFYNFFPPYPRVPYHPCSSTHLPGPYTITSWEGDGSRGPGSRCVCHGRSHLEQNNPWELLQPPHYPWGPLRLGGKSKERDPMETMAALFQSWNLTGLCRGLLSTTRPDPGENTQTPTQNGAEDYVRSSAPAM